MVFFVLMYRGHFFPIAYWKQLCAKPVIDCWEEQKEKKKITIHICCGILSLVKNFTTFHLTRQTSFPLSSDAKSNRPVRANKTVAKQVEKKSFYRYISFIESLMGKLKGQSASLA